MTIIKTKEFDQQFQQDRHWIEINRNLPLWDKGSYKVKEWGDLVTDIDLQARVRYFPNLINIISNVLEKNRRKKSRFIFIHMAVGRYDGYDIPWTIDDNGGCDYDPERVKVWWNEFKNRSLVPDHIRRYIKSKLFDPEMRISNLIDVENALHPYAEIVWSEDDIRKGFIQRDGKRYDLLDVMKTETPVLEYVYHYRNNEYVAIDVGLVDNRFKVPIKNKIYLYYMEDWYRILKTFRWKLSENDKETYFQVMNGITNLIALKYQIGFIEKLAKGNVLPSQQIDSLLHNTYAELDKLGINHRGIELSEISKYLYENVNNILADSVKVYANKLENYDERKEILNRLSRGAQAHIPSTQEQLVLRRQNGFSCPFFATDLDEYEQLTDLAIRMDMDVELVINCFSRISIGLGKPVAQIIKDIVSPNQFSILIDKDKVVLKENGREKGRYPISLKTKLQAYVLLKRN